VNPLLSRVVVHPVTAAGAPVVTTFPRSSSATQREADGQATAASPIETEEGGTPLSTSTGKDHSSGGRADAGDAPSNPHHSTTRAAVVRAAIPCPTPGAIIAAATYADRCTAHVIPPVPSRFPMLDPEYSQRRGAGVNNSSRRRPHATHHAWLRPGPARTPSPR
jgi:hypothetical protein